MHLILIIGEKKTKTLFPTLLRDSLHLLQSGDGLLPCGGHAAQLLNQIEQLFLVHAHLFAAVTLTQRHRVILKRAMIHRDGERNAELIRASVSLTDRDGGGVEFRGDTLGGERAGDVFG